MSWTRRQVLAAGATAATSAAIGAWYGIPRARRLHQAYKEELAALEAQKAARESQGPQVLSTLETRIRDMASRSAFGWNGRFREGYDPLAKLESGIKASLPVVDDTRNISTKARSRQVRNQFDNIISTRHNEDFMGTEAVANDEARYIAVLSLEAPGMEMTVIQVLDLDQYKKEGDGLVVPVTQYTCRGGKSRDLDLWEVVRTHISSDIDGMYPIGGKQPLAGMKIFSYEDAVEREGIVLAQNSQTLENQGRHLPSIMQAFYGEAIQTKVNKSVPDDSIKVYDNEILIGDEPHRVMIWTPVDSDGAYNYLEARAYPKDELRANGNDYRRTMFKSYVGTKKSHFDAFRSGIAQAPPGSFTNSPVRYFLPAAGYAGGFDEGRLSATKEFRTIVRKAQLS